MTKQPKPEDLIPNVAYVEQLYSSCLRRLERLYIEAETERRTLREKLDKSRAETERLRLELREARREARRLNVYA